MRPGLALSLLILAAFAAGSARGTWRLPAGLVLAALALTWFHVNGPMEGEVLISVSPDRGFTAADIGGVLALGLGAYRILVPSFQWAWGQRTDAG